MHALNPAAVPSPTTTRIVGVACNTFALLLHGIAIKVGVRVQDALGMFKLVVLVGIALSGLAVMAGLPGFKLENVSDPVRAPDMLSETDVSPRTTSDGRTCGQAVCTVESTRL